MNAYLKEIANLRAFYKKVTFYVAHHAFATTVSLSKGVPIETVSKMSEHRTIKPHSFMLRFWM
mgnify:FL=1